MAKTCAIVQTQRGDTNVQVKTPIKKSDVRFPDFRFIQNRRQQRRFPLEDKKICLRKQAQNGKRRPNRRKGG